MQFSLQSSFQYSTFDPLVPNYMINLFFASSVI